MSAHSLIPTLRLALLDIFVPVACAGCGDSGASPCPRCSALLAHIPAHALSIPDIDAPIFAKSQYKGVTRRLLLAHKDGGRNGLTTPLGLALADAVKQSLTAVVPPPGKLVLVPVPSRSVNIRRRGRFTTGELAHVARKDLPFPAVVESLLRITQPVLDQVGLSRAQRQSNMEFAMTSLPGNADVVIVDDVITSGASVREAYRALTHAGHNVISIAAVCAR